MPGRFFISGLLAVCIASLAQAQTFQSGNGAPVEIVKQHDDIDVQADGTFARAAEVAYRALDQQGVQLLQKLQLSYMDGFQSLEVEAAYTLKADGKRIDVTPDGMVYGRGNGALQSLKLLTIVFPDLEPGDEIVLVTLSKQLIPWFKYQYYQQYSFSHLVVARDVQIDMTAPANFPLNVDAYGVEGGEVNANSAGKQHWQWRYHNDVALTRNPEDVAEIDDGPHIFVSSFQNYAAVAHVFAGPFDDNSKVNPAIQALADQLTAGISDRREQARALYEWTSSHIGYVNIVLGAGGYIPDSAGDVLNMKYGDCKDHVMLLKALLAAKQIQSSAVLISAGNAYRLPAVASPMAFNHLITYIPEFHTFLDSTARYAPFGVLPWEDAGKSVLVVSTGETMQTPPASADDTRLRIDQTVTFAADGSATGDAHVEATGAIATALRGLISAISAAASNDYLRAVMGPGAEGTIDRADVAQLTPTLSYAVHYRLRAAADFHGPGAFGTGIGYRPFSFTSMLAGTFPPSRTRAYFCPSVTMDENETIVLPPGVDVPSLPKDGNFERPGLKLTISYDKPAPNTVHGHAFMRIDHPQPVCAADDYNRMRKDLDPMIAALRAQIVYR